MKKTAMILAASSLLVMGSTAMASESGTIPLAKNAKDAVRGFFEAEKSVNVDAMMQFADDTRFTSAADEKSFYQNHLEMHPLQSYKILSETKIDGSHEQITVQTSYKNFELTPSVTYDVNKENGVWKMVIKGVVFNAEKGSADYGKTMKLPGKIEWDTPQQTISPNVAVTYWRLSNPSGDGLEPNRGRNYGNFNQMRTDGIFTINGWQNWSPYYPSSCIYYVEQVLPDGSSSVLDSATVYGNYPENGNWYSSTMKNVPYGTNYEMLIMNMSSSYYVYGAGNGYE